MVTTSDKRAPQFLRSVQNRPALRRRSSLAVFGQLMMVVSGIALGGGIAYAAYGYAAASDSFVLKALAVDTVPERVRSLVRRQLEPALGRNLLMLDLDPLRERVERIPQVKTARVRRMLPDTLEVDVSLRGPWGRLHAPDGAWLVSRDGVLLGPDPQSDPSLPRVSVVAALRPELDARRRVPRHTPGGRFFDDAVTIVDWLRQTRRDLFGQIAYLRLDPTGVVLVLSSPQRMLYVGDSSQIEVKFDNLDVLASQHALAGNSVIDLRYRDMVIVREPDIGAGSED